MEMIYLIIFVIIVVVGILYNVFLMQYENVKNKKIIMVEKKRKYVYVFSIYEDGVMSCHKKPDDAVKSAIDFLWEKNIKNRALALGEYEYELNYKGYVTLDENGDYRIDRITLD